ncbi:hypothetical protein ACHAXN_007129, partial [Cyclotella atomus]
VGPVASQESCLDACSACKGPPSPGPLNLGSVDTPAITEACATSSSKSAINSGDELGQASCFLACDRGLCCFSEEEFFGSNATTVIGWMA